MSYDISRLYINFSECPKDKRLVEHFGELNPFKEFHVADDNRIKIAILLGDIDSPFVRIKERESMVRSIFSFLGINEKDDPDFLNNVINYKDDLTSFCWLRYLQILHETDFTDLLLCRKDYDYFLTRSNEPKGENESDKVYLAKRNDIRETIKKLGQEMRAIEAKIFPDSKAAREAALAEAKSRISLYAEKYASDYTHI